MVGGRGAKGKEVYDGRSVQLGVSCLKLEQMHMAHAIARHEMP